MSLLATLLEEVRIVRCHEWGGRLEKEKERLRARARARQRRREKGAALVTSCQVASGCPYGMLWGGCGKSVSDKKRERVPV